MPSESPIPVVDIFAGAGGLGEGFASCGERQQFQVVLSVEKNGDACETLETRAFFRQFRDGEVPEEYYQYIRGEIGKDALFEQHPDESSSAQDEVWHAEFGEIENQAIASKIEQALGAPSERDWVLVGGPPCQAFSVMGRARVGCDELSEDPRHDLYRHYLNILSEYRPTVFILENVCGLLSAKVGEDRLFDQIVRDLANPQAALDGTPAGNGLWKEEHEGVEYEIRPVVAEPPRSSQNGKPPELNYGHGWDRDDFIVRAEEFGVPQARHRVFLMGVRKDVDFRPEDLLQVNVRKSEDAGGVLRDIPPLRCRLTRQQDGSQERIEAIKSGLHEGVFDDVDDRVLDLIRESTAELDPKLGLGGRFVEWAEPSRKTTGELSEALREWLHDEKIGGVCNHEARGHMKEDLHRYLFAAAYTRVHEESPKLHHYPAALLPNHKNVNGEVSSSTSFADRFRVQTPEGPSTTVTSHISKDGHYFIHYDPTQVRSLTAREVARLQTFPDNYFFEGSRTQQYIQIGNAVPPFLAKQIAAAVERVVADQQEKVPA